MIDSKSFTAEALGTFILTFVGCGAVVSAVAMIGKTGGQFGYTEIIGIAIGFGVALMAAAYSMGPISGGHFNPAVSVGLALAGRFEWKAVPAYMGAQFIGGILAALVLMAAAGGVQNGLGQTTVGSFGVGGALVMEAVLTFLLVFIILGATCSKAIAGFAGVPIGLYLGAAQIVGIPYSGASLNPARSFGPAIFVGGPALTDFWIYLVAPLVGGVAAALVYKLVDPATECEIAPAP